MKRTPQLLFKNRRPGETVWLRDYEQTGGYQGLKKALRELQPEQLRALVKDSGLRGRGGAGFPTGVKWSFFPADQPGPKYLICNCDEMEPGTYKDGELLQADPHQLIEGMIIAAYALQTESGYIFIRYAYREQFDHLRRALAEATAAG
jgi:NADH-quinone oxidoreductase subunit F